MDNSDLKSKINDCIINTNLIIKKWRENNKIDKLSRQVVDKHYRRLEFKQYVISLLKHQFRKNLNLDLYRFRELSRSLFLQLDDDLLIAKISLLTNNVTFYDEVKEINNHIQSLTELDYFTFKNKNKKIEQSDLIYFNNNFNINLQSIESIKF